ncbi:MAG: transposase [Cyanobacteria bacterium P01_F01_bin.150]
MGRQPRDLQANYCYHITVRCNNREFRLTQLACKDTFLYAIKKCQEQFGFKLYGLCIMSNHVHYLLEPMQPEDLPRIMHWLNWYTAMCFNQMLNRTGHFWEKRYHSSGFPSSDHRRVLNTLRYIHGNPKAANMQTGWFYDFSNYGSYERLTQDGITEWHPAFLLLGKTLDCCAAIYRAFCQSYQTKPKPERKKHWGSQLLKSILGERKPKLTKHQRARTSPGQLDLDKEQKSNSIQVSESNEIQDVAKRFICANCYNPEVAMIRFSGI